MKNTAPSGGEAAPQYYPPVIEHYEEPEPAATSKPKKKKDGNTVGKERKGVDQKAIDDAAGTESEKEDKAPSRRDQASDRTKEPGIATTSNAKVSPVGKKTTTDTKRDGETRQKPKAKTMTDSKNKEPKPKNDNQEPPESHPRATRRPISRSSRWSSGNDSMHEPRDKQSRC